MPTLNKVFLEVFGEALIPLGFKKIKGRHPYFVRLVGDEIIHVITCMKKPVPTPGCKEFTILGGIATVYRQNITLDWSPLENSNWFSEIMNFYINNNSFNINDEVRKSLDSFLFDEDIIVNEMKRSLKVTEKHILPLLNDVITLNSCIDFFYKYIPGITYIRSNEKLNYEYPKNTDGEGLLYIKTNYRGDFKERIQSYVSNFEYAYKTGIFTKETYEKQCKDIKEGYIEQKTRCDKIFNNPELYSRCMAELDRRKAANIETLRSYGLDI